MFFEWTENEDGVPNHLNKLTLSPLLCLEEEAILVRKAKNGDLAARTRLVESNMRLVINIARSYRTRSIPIEDLIQEGAIGLIHAIRRFDPEKGFRFSTYATHWIRQAIGRAIDYKAKAIRLPAHITQSIRRVERERIRLERELGRDPTHEQLAAAIGLSPRKLMNLMQSGQEMISLDAKIGDTESSTLGSMIRDGSVEDPEDVMLNEELVRELHLVMMDLTDRERRVMQSRLRIDGAIDGTERDDLASELQISRERIRQIELQAMKKLRAMASIRLREILTR
ncbi:MAG: RNA polymerase sigma factor RpoD/SigA [Armatimonadetes bacterium]|nr:RNA polymerase sigma factor RpoD/SigA [Armatimonadota bacterium]